MGHLSTKLAKEVISFGIAGDFQKTIEWQIWNGVSNSIPNDYRIFFNEELIFEVIFLTSFKQIHWTQLSEITFILLTK